MFPAAQAPQLGPRSIAIRWLIEPFVARDEYLVGANDERFGMPRRDGTGLRLGHRGRTGQCIAAHATMLLLDGGFVDVSCFGLKANPGRTQHLGSRRAS